MGSANLATVKICNTDTDEIIHSSSAVEDGEATASGAFAMDGVAGTGSPVQLQFMDPAGTKTGKSLPTGKLIHVLEGVEVTCIDVANPCVFVNATSLGIDGATLPAQMDSHPTMLSQLESIRQHAALSLSCLDALKTLFSHLWCAADKQR